MESVALGVVRSPFSASSTATFLGLAPEPQIQPIKMQNEDGKRVVSNKDLLRLAEQREREMRAGMEKKQKPKRFKGFFSNDEPCKGDFICAWLDMN